jgi:pyruvate dehydrogenase E2 component (dihydrolipoamide acetyltransferase)
MPFEIRVPRLGWSMEEGVFVRWLKQEGDFVKAGEMLFELESEKATQEIESLDSGILRIAADGPAPGSVVAVGSLLGYLLAEGEEISLAPSPQARSASEGNAGIQSTAAGSPVQSAAGQASSATQLTASEARRSSPRARRVARELGVDWRQLRGTGRSGRVRERDVRAAAERGVARAAGPPGTAGQASRAMIPITPRRRLIAERMVASLERTAAVTLTTRADATSLVRFRDQWKTASPRPAPAYTDILAKLVAAALAEHPRLGARWEQDHLVLPPAQIDVGLAVDTEEGLLVPVLRDVARTPLGKLAEQSRELVAKARVQQLSSADLEGGVFTITNLGAYGVDAFTPIIHYPQTAILGVGAIYREPAFSADGSVVLRDVITLSLTFDHRIVDGAPAARFLQTLCRLIEDQASYASWQP